MDYFVSAWDVVHRLSGRGRSALETPNEDGDYALHVAADNCDPFVIELIFRLGATDFSVRDTKGRTPLYRAAQRRRFEAFEKLIRLGADICCRTNKNKTLWYPVIGELGSVANLQRLLELNVPGLHERDARGHTLLDYAIFKGNSAAGLFLLEHGCEFTPDSTNKRGRSWLRCAASSASAALLRKLRERGLSFDYTDSKGRTLLHFASAYNDDDGALRELGTDIDAKDNDGMTPMVYALFHLHEWHSCKLLLSRIKRLHDIGSNAHFTPDNEGNMPWSFLPEEHYDYPLKLYLSRALLDTLLFALDDRPRPTIHMSPID